MKRQTYLILFILAINIPSLLWAQSGQGDIQLQVNSLCMEDSIRFSILNKGTIDLRQELDYYVIEDEIILRESSIDSLDSGDSIIFIHQLIHKHQGAEVSLELENPNKKKGKMIGAKVFNCGLPYPLVYRQLDGKLNQVITGKHNNPWAVGLYAGTLGPGLNISKNMGPALTMRLGGTFLPLNFKTDEFWGRSNTSLKIKLFTIDLKMDYYISKNPNNKFHLTLGGLYNGSILESSSEPNFKEPITIGNQIITEEEVGSAAITIQPSKFNIFLGAGYGRLVPYNKRVGMKIELGGVFIGSPKASLDATGVISPTAEEEEQLQNNLKQYYIYPSMNLYLSIKI